MFQEYSEEEISKVTDILKDYARKKETCTYQDVFQFDHWGNYSGPHDRRLWDLLGIISEREIALGHYALSAIVITKDAGHPGQGFFNLEKKLGRYKNNDIETWLMEIHGLFEYWSTAL